MKITAQEWDDKHPEVWEIFVEQSLGAIEDGETRWSAALIAYDIRFVRKIGVSAEMTAYYARKFMELYDKPGFFETRPSKFDIDDLALVEEDWVAT